MKKYGVLCLLVFTLFGCSKYDDSEIWDYVKGMNSRLTALEEKCKEINTNISALQTIVSALEKNDCITNVAPITKDGAVLGYTISFLKSAPITIYNGKDGNDGYTPVIGVKQDTDDLYYWTIDGEWLLTTGGEKVRASGIDGNNGTNGTNGTDGTNGDNGITPQLKIENEYWYVSYDAGTSWQMLGKATGNKGTDGVSFFSSVTVGISEVTFVLADGTTFSIPLQSSLIETEHEYVDLGLPSGTLWATCNVGADIPWEYGYYFAWGETEPRRGDYYVYNWTTYKYCNGNYKQLTKYCINSSYGMVDGKTILESLDDAATANWGDEWKMPSKEQFEELSNSNYTIIEKKMQYGVNGIKITSKSNNKSIFLSAAGLYNGGELYYEGETGLYWTCELSLSTVEPGCLACTMGFGSAGHSGRERCTGLPVRPVKNQ